VTVRVSSPQSESFASVYETPGDLIRLALGLAVCLWIVMHLFMLPRTTEGYRTWVYGQAHAGASVLLIRGLGRALQDQLRHTTG